MDDPGKMTGVCDQCGKVFDCGSAWRWNGETWEHKCEHMHPQAGHCGQLISTELAAARIEIAALQAALDALEVPANPYIVARFHTFLNTAIFGVPAELVEKAHQTFKKTPDKERVSGFKSREARVGRECPGGWPQNGIG